MSRGVSLDPSPAYSKHEGRRLTLSPATGGVTTVDTTRKTYLLG